MGKIRKTKLIRSSRELNDIINYVRAKYILSGKVPPSTSRITKIIANNIDKEVLLKDVIIRF